MKIERIQLPREADTYRKNNGHKVESEEKNTLGNDAVHFDLKKRRQNQEQQNSEEAAEEESEAAPEAAIAHPEPKSSGSGINVVV